MVLQSTGQITLDDIHVEAGGTTGTLCSINDTDILALLTTATAPHSFSEWYGASAFDPFSTYWKGSTASYSDSETVIVSGASVTLYINRAGTVTATSYGGTTGDLGSEDWHSSPTSTIGDDFDIAWYNSYTSYWPDGCWYQSNHTDTTCGTAFTWNSLGTSRYWTARPISYGNTHNILSTFLIRDTNNTSVNETKNIDIDTYWGP